MECILGAVLAVFLCDKKTIKFVWAKIWLYTRCFAKKDFPTETSYQANFTKGLIKESQAKVTKEKMTERSHTHTTIFTS